jgi:hypothetical protein
MASDTIAVFYVVVKLALEFASDVFAIDSGV